MPNMNILSQNIKEEIVLRAISKIDSKYIYLTLIFDSMVTSMIRSETFVIVYAQ